MQPAQHFIPVFVPNHHIDSYEFINYLFNSTVPSVSLQKICSAPTLFPDDINLAHSKQGLLGDCWFLCACSFLLRNKHLLNKVRWHTTQQCLTANWLTRTVTLFRCCSLTSLSGVTAGTEAPSSSVFGSMDAGWRWSLMTGSPASSPPFVFHDATPSLPSGCHCWRRPMQSK